MTVHWETREHHGVEQYRLVNEDDVMPLTHWHTDHSEALAEERRRTRQELRKLKRETTCTNTAR